MDRSIANMMAVVGTRAARKAPPQKMMGAVCDAEEEVRHGEVLDKSWSGNESVGQDQEEQDLRDKDGETEGASATISSSHVQAGSNGAFTAVCVIV